MVSTRLKNISQNGNLPQVGVKIKNIWNHHPDVIYKLCKQASSQDCRTGACHLTAERLQDLGFTPQDLLCPKKVWSRNGWYVTLPKTNIAPENRPFQKEINLPTILFQGYVSFREGTPAKFNSWPLKIYRAPKGEDRLPTIHFSGAFAVKHGYKSGVPTVFGFVRGTSKMPAIPWTQKNHGISSEYHDTWYRCIGIPIDLCEKSLLNK